MRTGIPGAKGMLLFSILFTVADFLYPVPSGR